ncbi:hypothetical protein ACFFK0_27400 [Paenibacillus chartarius]|uniref:Uncharacterized protein n=1 Tax=Paenibacillus chartarius TaxID=747481 RepID=A0ABV6DTZ2_9BACL
MTYGNGELLHEDRHFYDHVEYQVPVQVYCQGIHRDIGYVEYYSEFFIKVNNTYYNRKMFTFVSRPGY